MSEDQLICVHVSVYRCVSVFICVCVYVQVKGFELGYLEKVVEVKDTVHRQSLLYHTCSQVLENYPESSDVYSEIPAITRSAKVQPCYPLSALLPCPLFSSIVVCLPLLSIFLWLLSSVLCSFVIFSLCSLLCQILTGDHPVCRWTLNCCQRT